MLTDHTQPYPPPQLEAIRQATIANGFSMPSEALTGALLRTLAASKPGGKLLELGTGTGLATAWLLAGMDAAATLVSVDSDGAVQSIAQSHLGDDPRVRFVHQPGEQFIQAATAEVVRYDLIFADTWPGKYWLLEEALSLLAPAGFYVIDDMLPQANWPADHPPKVAALIADLEARRDVVVTKMAWASGLMILTRTTHSQP
jgi:predicted O-methyltransferase YrrM